MKITGVAIKLKDIVYSRSKGRHHMIISTMTENGVNPKQKEAVQGFILEDNTFLNRIEAGKHAIRIGQIEKLKWPPKLNSEDLW